MAADATASVLTTLKTAMLAPMASAKMRIEMIGKAGSFRSSAEGVANILKRVGPVILPGAC